MLFTLKELQKWLQITIFEIALMLTSLLVFTILVALKLENIISITWWEIFIPLYVSDTLMVYFDFIVFIKLYLVGEKSLAVKRIIVNGIIILLMIIYKVLLCQQLEHAREMKYAVIHSPLFIFIFFIMVRSCYANDHS